MRKAIALLIGMATIMISSSIAEAATKPSTNALKQQEAVVACQIDTGYQVLLGRAPDESGYQFWRSNIRQGKFNTSQLINSILPDTNEYKTSRNSASRLSVNNFVNRLVRFSYSRNPTAAERTWWNGFIAQHGRTQAVAYSTTDRHSRCWTASLFANYQR